MEVGLTAGANAANAAEADVEQLVVGLVSEIRRELVLANGIQAATVGPIIEALAAAEPGEKLRLYIRANGGGSVQQLMLLIEALVRTKADVQITIGRFAMSCAAVLWLWFALDPLEGDDGVGRVVSVDPLKPTVLLYHRPRWPYGENGEYYCFIEHFEDEAVRENLKAQVDLFDELFERLLERLGMNPLHPATVSQDGATYLHHLHFAKETYYANRDYVISLEGAVS